MVEPGFQQMPGDPGARDAHGEPTRSAGPEGVHDPFRYRQQPIVVGESGDELTADRQAGTPAKQR